LTLGTGQALAVLTGALALAIMIGCAIFERSVSRRQRGRRRADRPDSSSTIGLREAVSPGFAGTVAAGSAVAARKSTVAMRRAVVTRAPRQPGDADCDIEQSLQRLLKEWQRLAA
jgi:hypothetical protein